MPDALDPAASQTLRNSGTSALLVLLEVIHQLLGDLRGEGPIGGGRAVAGVAVHAHFVLQLDHDDGVLPAVHVLDVPHEGREGAGIGVAVASLKGLSSSMLLPPAVWARGKRSKFRFTQPGG